MQATLMGESETLKKHNTKSEHKLQQTKNLKKCLSQIIAITAILTVSDTKCQAMRLRTLTPDTGTHTPRMTLPK